MKTLPLLLALATPALAAPPEPKFRAQDLDAKIQIGYGVAVADVDGDAKPDVLLADKKQFVWYRNPGKRGAAWDKFVLAENLTEHDNVCLAAQDIDGDGKCEVAVGAEWNPGDTEKSGAVFYLIPPADRTHRWEPVKFPIVEPTTHRMKWLKLGIKEWGLVVVPLHGRGNRNNEGAGAKVLLYGKPDDPKAEWKSMMVDESMHATHNFALWPAKMVASPGGRQMQSNPAIILAGKEGIVVLVGSRSSWSPRKLIWGAPAPTGSETILSSPDFKGAGELHIGKLKPGSGEIIATVEPMHGNQLVFYTNLSSNLERHVLTDKLIQGHALACGDVLGMGADQIVVGWRGNIPPKPQDKVGIAVWTALDDKGEKWRESLVDDNTMACEDLALADLDGDGKLDIVASGRATKNVKIYWNER